MVKHLSPAYFALVMATGVVSIAAWDLQLPLLAIGLFVFNIVAYVVVAGLTVLRAIRYPRLFFADMTDHRLGPSFFTAIAGSCILGTQFLQMAHKCGDCGRVLGSRYRAVDRPDLHDLYRSYGQA